MPITSQRFSFKSVFFDRREDFIVNWPSFAAETSLDKIAATLTSAYPKNDKQRLTCKIESDRILTKLTGPSGTAAINIFNWNSLSIDFELWNNNKHQGKGYSGPFMTGILAICDSLGISEIKSLEVGRQLGAAVWPKYGFLNLHTSHFIEEKVKKRVKELAPELKKTKAGKAFLKFVENLDLDRHPEKLWVIANSDLKVKPPPGYCVNNEVWVKQDKEAGESRIGMLLLANIYTFYSCDLKKGSESRAMWEAMAARSTAKIQGR